MSSLFTTKNKKKNGTSVFLRYPGLVGWGVRDEVTGGVAHHRVRLKFIGVWDGVGRGSPAPAGGES